MLCTVTELKEFLKITDNNNDNILNNIIYASDKFIENFCNQNIESAVNVFYISGNGNTLLKLPSIFPITALYAISFRNTFADAFTALTTSDFEIVVIDKVDYLYSSATFVNGLSNYKIELTSGYAPTAIPNDIKQVSIELSAIGFKNSDAGGTVKGGRLGLNSSGESLDGINLNTSFQSEIKHHIDVLNKYKRILL